ncbi:MAG: hypothetical protein KF797_07225 [Flavobacteriales bacterium]|nr:hypothetical protein [Flavobacteriales bacterium]
MKALLASALLFSALQYVPVHAQGKLVDRRDQAQGWYVPVHGQVLVEGRKTDGCKLVLYKNNEKLGELHNDKRGRFELELDIDATYAVRIIKEGYQEKLITIDTSLPMDLVRYPDYECTVSLQKTASPNVDPFYTDFPSAIVRYNADLGGFYHSETYLTHIQTRLSGYAKAGQ